MAITNAPNNNEVITTSTYYKHTRPVFEDMMNYCKTKKRFEEFVKMMETQYYRPMSENGVLPHNTKTRSTYAFGKSDTNQRSIPQKKFAYEKRKQYKK